RGALCPTDGKDRRLLAAAPRTAERGRAMRLRLLGNSGLRVSELCLGTMTFGEDWGWGADEATSRRIFTRFTDAGGNFVDTSNNYTDGSSERIVGDCVASERDSFVVATKFTLRMATGNSKD